MQTLHYATPAPPPPPRRSRIRWALVSLGLMALVAPCTAGMGLAAGGSLAALWPDQPALGPGRGAALRIAAEARMRAGDFTGAIAGFDAALRADPTDAVAERRGRDARYAAGQCAAPIESLLVEAPARAALLRARAERLAAEGQASQALAAFEAAFALAPVTEHDLARRAALRLAADDAAGAVKDLQACVDRAPEDDPLAIALVEACRQAGEGDRADALALARFEPRVAHEAPIAVHEALIAAYRHMGLSAAALSARYRHAAPGVSEARRARALAAASARLFFANPHWNAAAGEQALTACQQALAGLRDPHDRAEVALVAARVHAARARHLDDRGEAARALGELALALAATVGSPAERAAWLVERAHLLIAAGRGEEANRAFGEALALQPTHACRRELAEREANAGWALVGLGKPAAAIAPLERALALQPDDPRALARCYTAMARVEPATALARCGRLAAIADPAERLARLVRGLGAEGRAAEAHELARHATGHAAPLVRAELALLDGQLDAARALLARGSGAAGDRRLLALALDAGRLAPRDAQARERLERAARAAGLRLLAASDDAAARDGLAALERAASQAALAEHQARRAAAHAAAGLTLAPSDPLLARLRVTAGAPLPG